MGQAQERRGLDLSGLRHETLKPHRKTETRPEIPGGLFCEKFFYLTYFISRKKFTVYTVYTKLTCYLLCNLINIARQHDRLFNAIFLKIYNCLF